MSDALETRVVIERLALLPQWRLASDMLVRDVACGDFDGSIAFVNRVADAARAANHHPGISIDWGTVTLTLVSHDVGAISERDFALARTIDALAG